MDTVRGESPRWLRRMLAGQGEKLRYLVVGAWNTLFGYLVYLILLSTVGPLLHPFSAASSWSLALVGGYYYLVVGWLGWLVAVPQSTITMKYLVFRNRAPLLPQIARAFLVYLPAQALGSAVLWVFVGLLHLIPQVGAFLTIGVTTVFSYLGHKYFTFRAPLEVGEVPEEELMK